jgi:hypothetical protein
MLSGHGAAFVDKMGRSMTNDQGFSLFRSMVADNQVVILMALCPFVFLSVIFAVYSLFRGRRLERRVSELQRAAQAMIRAEEARLMKEQRGDR